MSRITTADCVQAINDAAAQGLPQAVQDLAPRWRRLSKRGRGGETITRVFSSHQAPWVKAVVEETPGGQLRVEFAQRHVWELKQDEDVDWEEMEAWHQRPEIAALPGPRPGDFVFGIGREEIWGDEPEVFVFLCPRANPEWDQHLGAAVDVLLPRGTSGEIPGEISESTYVLDYPDIGSGLAAMKEAGFVHDPEMDGEMGC